MTSKAVTAGAAFRQAYSETKLVKSFLWGATLLLAIIQLVAAIVDKSAFDLTSATVITLCAYVLLGSFGKSAMQAMHMLGCNVQRVHDFLTLEVGRKPNDFDLPQSKITRLANRWLRKNKTIKQRELETWWDESLNEVNFAQARLICSCVTFYWEVELRKKYQLFLSLILALSILVPLAVSLYFDFGTYKMIVLALAPFTPFVSLVLEEWLVNKSCLSTALDIRRNCQDLWKQVINKTASNEVLMAETNSLMESWQIYRMSTLPIFNWLYVLTRRRMEDDMIVDTKSLVQQVKHL